MGQAFGCFLVGQTNVAITEQFGKFDDVLEPGCHCVPYCLGKTVAGRLPTGIQKRVCPCPTKTKDNVFVTVSVSVHYQTIKDKARDAFYSRNGNKIQDYVSDVVIPSLAKYELADAFEHKDEIDRAIEKDVGKAMEALGYQIVRVLVVEIQPKLTNTATKLMKMSPKDASDKDVMEITKKEIGASPKSTKVNTPN